MKQTVAKNFPKCALCRHWYDPANSAIEPTAAQGLWKIETGIKNKCLIKNCNMQSNMFCSKFESKV